MRAQLITAACVTLLLGACDSSKCDVEGGDGGDCPDVDTGVVGDGGGGKPDGDAKPDRVDTGIDVVDATTCFPADVSGFAALPMKPAKTPTNECTTTQIDSYYASCLDQVTSSSTKCQAFTTNNKPCAQCITSNKTDASWGPLISGKGIVTVNVAGCIQLQTGDSTTSGCAYKFQSSRDCQSAACDVNCPVTDDASFQEYVACTQEAADNGCKAFTDAVDAACNADAAPSAQTCLAPTSFKDYYDVITPIFCAAGGG